MRLFRSVIDDEYRIDWIVDNLPGAMRNEEYDYVTRGFPVGFVAPPAFEGGHRMHYLYNHGEDHLRRPKPMQTAALLASSPHGSPTPTHNLTPGT